jgi:adenylate cyclase
MKDHFLAKRMPHIPLARNDGDGTQIWSHALREIAANAQFCQAKLSLEVEPEATDRQSTMGRVIRFESQYDLPFPPEAVWPALSNTDWVNRSLGLPAVRYEFTANAEGGSTVRARARAAGLEVAWRELPFEWLEPEFYRVRRIFENGPLREAVAGIELLPTSGATQLRVISEVIPRNTLGKFLARKVLFPKTRRDFRRITAQVTAFLKGQRPVALPRLTVQPVDEAALKAGLEKLGQAGVRPEHVERLRKMLCEAPDVELTHIRPLAIARQWNADPWEVLSLFLHATRSGLLDFRWEILCPNCRSSRQPPVKSLSGLARTSHCEVCQIEFDAQFDRSVELKFAVNPSVRRRDDQTFCLAGPGGKPHVLSQTWLEPGEERLWKLPTLTRPVRLRSPQVRGSVTIDPGELGEDRPTLIRTSATGFEIGYGHGDAQRSAARLHNPNAFPVLLSLDQMGWSDDILTAARVTNWQEFRDLFSNEVISPDEEIVVGSQVILFTDLRGSTALYGRIGDAPAYALVRDHFTILTAAVRRHHGTVVKTIGDAVMACFSRVDEALGAVHEMNRDLLTPRPQQPGSASLTLKASLHVGACLAVNANDRLDFFGSTINLAARMVSCCHGGDLAVSDEIFQRPEMEEFLKGCPASPMPSEVRFRGFNAPRRVWMISMAMPPARLQSASTGPS